MPGKKPEKITLTPREQRAVERRVMQELGKQRRITGIQHFPMRFGTGRTRRVSAS